MLSFSAHAGSSVSFMWKVRFRLRVVKGRLLRQEFMSTLCHRPATTICVSFTVDLCVSLTLTIFYLQFAVIDRVPGFCRVIQYHISCLETGFFIPRIVLSWGFYS